MFQGRERAVADGGSSLVDSRTDRLPGNRAGLLVLFFESGLVGVRVDGFAVPMLVLVCLVVPVFGHHPPFS